MYTKVRVDRTIVIMSEVFRPRRELEVSGVKKYFFNEGISGSKGGKKHFTDRDIQEFINAHPHTVVAMDTGDRPWVEIDFPEDYKVAQAAFSQS